MCSGASDQLEKSGVMNKSKLRNIAEGYLN